MAAGDSSEAAKIRRIRQKPGAFAVVLRRLRSRAALTQLKLLRGMQGPDADLELTIALDEARTGLSDSAWARLHGPILAAALADTAGLGRRSEYPFQREGAWVNGRFDGW